MTDEQIPNDVIDTYSITTPQDFAKALDALRRRSGRHIAEPPGLLPHGATEISAGLHQFLRGERLPTPKELHQVLLTFKIPRPEQDEWQLALMRIQGGVNTEQRIAPYVLPGSRKGPTQSRVKKDFRANEESDPNLLLRIYIPSARIYAAEASRLLSLFREWLSATHGYDVRQSGYSTSSGEMFEFFADASVGQPDLHEEFDSFSVFLKLCSDNASAAADVLTSAGIDRKSSVKLVAKFGREVQRLQIDLRHEREQRMLTIRQDVEDQLLESGVDLRNIPRDQITALIESRFPDSSAPESLALLAVPWTAQPTSPVTVNINPQIISAMEGTIIQNVQGTVHLGPQVREILEFIEEYGGQQTWLLKSLLYDLEDQGAPSEARSAAKQRLKKFASGLAGSVRDLGIELLEKYLESKGL